MWLPWWATSRWRAASQGKTLALRLSEVDTSFQCRDAHFLLNQGLSIHSTLCQHTSTRSNYSSFYIIILSFALCVYQAKVTQPTKDKLPLGILGYGLSTGIALRSKITIWNFMMVGKWHLVSLPYITIRYRLVSYGNLLYLTIRTLDYLHGRGID